jgi:putative ABC transport system permease protein
MSEAPARAGSGPASWRALAPLVAAEWRHRPWRTAAAVLAIVLGVALGHAVHVINASALREFDAAVRAVNGTPDLELRPAARGFDESLYARVANDPGVALASPVVEVETAALDVQGTRVPLRVIGIDALVVAGIAPALLPQPAHGADREALIDPRAVFLNAQAARRLDSAGHGGELRLLTPQGARRWKIAGRVDAPGPPLAVMDIAGAQAGFARLGRLSRIDVRLAPGADREAVVRRLALPEGVRIAEPGEAGERVDAMSRAYRVNLSVLALVALFTGSFLVYAVLALSVAQRQPQLALLGVLGLAPRERLRLVLGESVALGAIGSVLGLALGSALAAIALRASGGDLGGGAFVGVAPALHVEPGAALAYALLGIGAALLGGWWPARAAGQLAPAQALKGLGAEAAPRAPAWLGALLLVLAAVLADAPAIGGLPLAAYASVACLLLGGIALLPAALEALLARVPPPRHALALVALERVRRAPQLATVAVAGIVASLALSVSLVVMVGSFRTSMLHWLDVVLPADLYVRGAGPGGRDASTLAPSLVERIVALPGVARVEPLEVTSVELDPARPPVAVVARPLADPRARLPLTGEPVTLPPGETAAYASEALAELYGATPGTRLELPLPDGTQARVFVRGTWRDYARQHGTLAIDRGDWERLAHDAHASDLALWLAPGAGAGDVRAALRSAARAEGLDPSALEVAEPGAIRAASLRIFDRSFAVTVWLQAVAIGIGLFGIGASLSAQVLARRKEFGLLVHLGFTRAQVRGVVVAECTLAAGVGAALGVVLGLLVGVVLVEVVNPQSFHWTMDLMVPWARVAALVLSVLAAGALTGWAAARGAAARPVVLAVKEDW